MPPRRHLPSRIPLGRPQGASANTPRMPGAMLLYVALLFVGVVITARLFYLQVIRYDYYRGEARAEQLRKYEIPATRGDILAQDGGSTIPLVLNERLFSVIADPLEVKEDTKAAKELAGLLKTDRTKLEDRLQKEDSRYELIGSKVDRATKDKIVALKLRGIYVRENSYRTYPQGALAAQVLGFVNNDGEGQYGVEGFLDTKLKGEAGYLKAITDRLGVPLAANQGNVVTEPKAGTSLTLTLDLSLQRIAEERLKAGLDRVQSKAGSVIIMNPNSGDIKAMASYPSYDPGQYANVTDAALFTNPAVSDQLEPGSVMKPLLVGAARNIGAISRDFSYMDKNTITVDGITIKNSHYWGEGRENLQGILERSLNTGAVSILQQMGGGEVNAKARTLWHDYLVNKYRLGKTTGIEQSAEAEGSVASPTEGTGLNIQYANMSFGQGIAVTLTQMIAAEAALINGGTYWQPRLVSAENNQAVAPRKVQDGVVSSEVSREMRDLLVAVANANYRGALRNGYRVGGKTGTAEIAGPDGKYSADRFNGTFVGFVGADMPQYIIMVLVKEPKIGRDQTAGLEAAAPLFGDIVQAMIDNGSVIPQ